MQRRSYILTDQGDRQVLWSRPGSHHDVYGLEGDVNLHRVECGVQSEHRRLGRVTRSYTVSPAACALLLATILLQDDHRVLVPCETRERLRCNGSVSQLQGMLCCPKRLTGLSRSLHLHLSST